MKALKGEDIKKIQADVEGKKQLHKYIAYGYDEMIITLSTGEKFRLTNFRQ